jgi:hypothetical protein
MMTSSAAGLANSKDVTTVCPPFLPHLFGNLPCQAPEHLSPSIRPW